MQREELLQAIRDRNAVYRTCRTVAEENQDLAQEVDRLRLQLHRLEQDALLGSQPLARPAGDAGALRNDALRLSPLLWPRLAFGAVQRLSTSDSADFCRAVEAVCACAKDHCSAADAGVYSGDGDSVRAVQVAVTGVHVRDVAVSSPARQADCEGTGDAVSTLARRDSMSRGGYTDRMMTLEDVVSHFATSIVQGMLAMDGRVDLGRLRAHEESFRRMLLDVCWHSASSALAVSKELAEQDRKRAVSMPPNMRTLMSEELVETHEKLALAEKAVFSSQAELLDAYRQLASSGKETVTLRKQLVALQGESFKAHKELNEEVSFFRQVQEENRVQAAILKSHGPQLQQLSNEIRALKEARVALHRKVCDLEDLVLVMQEGQVAQAKSFVTLSNVARTAADRLNVVMDKRCRETCSLESLLSLALTAPPPSPGELQDDDDQYSYQHTPKDEEQEGGQGSSRRAGLVLNTAQDGMEGWAREALEEAAADLRRIVHDVGNEYGSEARVLEMLVEGLEPQVAHHMAILQKLQAPHGAAAATLARVLADKDGRHARLLAAEAAAQNAHVAHHHTPSAGQAVPLQRREHRSISLDCQLGPKTSGDVRGGTLFGRANLDSPGNAGGIGMSFSTGTDGCFYITGLRLGSPAALCGLLQVTYTVCTHQKAYKSVCLHHICVRACMYIYIYLYMYVHIFICVYIYVYAYTYVYIYT